MSGDQFSALANAVNQVFSEIGVSEMKEYPEEEVESLLLALGMIAQDSEEPETVRAAMITLYETQVGRQFLERNPIEP